MFDNVEVGKWITRGIIGLVFMYIGSMLIGQTPTININFGSAPHQPETAQTPRDDPRRSAEEQRTRAEFQRQEATARAEADAHRRRLEAARAQEEVEATRRRIRAAADAEREEKTRRAAAFRAQNGGCDPGWRRQCMTVSSSSGQQLGNLGCACVPSN